MYIYVHVKIVHLRTHAYIQTHIHDCLILNREHCCDSESKPQNKAQLN